MYAALSLQVIIVFKVRNRKTFRRKPKNITLTEIGTLVVQISTHLLHTRIPTGIQVPRNSSTHRRMPMDPCYEPPGDLPGDTGDPGDKLNYLGTQEEHKNDM